MSLDPSPSVREELPLHAAWVRRLAARLVRDERAAEDLAQETVLAALRARRPIRGALQPWLARVAANLARRGWRDAETRHRGERAAARVDEVAAPDDTLGRLEIQEQLVEELKRLDEPARTVLVRRYFDGWSAARIARQAGLPASTVRWHAQRGLAELRARLDRRSARDGISWRLALLPHALWRPHRVGSTLDASVIGPLSGVMAMKISVQLVVVASVVLVAGLGVYIVASDEGAVTREGVTPTELARAESPHMAPEPREELLAIPDARVAVPSTAREPASMPVESERAVLTLVDGRCVDQELVPIAGARIALEDNSESARIALEDVTRPSARSAYDGSFTLSCTMDAARVTLRVEASGFGTRFVDAVLAPDATHLGDVVLGPGGSLRGRVVSVSGAAFEGAKVEVTDTRLWGSLDEARRRGPNPYEPILRAVSARDGGFAVAGVPAGMVRVWASAPGMLHALTAPVEVPIHGETEELVLTLEPSEPRDVLHVVVLDPAGAPVPRARVSYTCRRRSGGSLVSSKVADEGGRVELAAPPDASFDVGASDPTERWFPISKRGLEARADTVELSFIDTPWIEVLVRRHDEAVRAKDDVVRAYSLAAFPIDAEPDLGPRVDHEDGRARVHAPPEVFAVVCDAPGYRVARLGPFAPETAPATIVFELEREPGLRGRVTAYGEPVSGARVTLHDADRRKRIDHDGYPSFVLPRALDETQSDAAGEFVLRARDRGEFVVRAESGGSAAADAGPFLYEPSAGRTDLELALTRGGAIEGRVLMPPGRELSGVIVAANRGDAHARTQRTNADGGFRFDGLTPGRWHVARGELEIESSDGGTAWEPNDRVTIDFNCTVVDGETTRCTIDLRDWQPCNLRGALALNGAPAANWDVELWPAGVAAIVGDLPKTSTNAEGRFEVERAEPGRVRLVLEPPKESGRGGSLSLELELKAGDNPWTADLVVGELRGTITSAASSEGYCYYESEAGSQPSCLAPIAPDADGRFVLPFVPAGRGAIYRARGSGAERTVTKLVDVEVPPRGTRDVHLP